jgi:hypothetical protein
MHRQRVTGQAAAGDAVWLTAARLTPFAAREVIRPDATLASAGVTDDLRPGDPGWAERQTLAAAFLRSSRTDTLTRLAGERGLAITAGDAAAIGAAGLALATANAGAMFPLFLLSFALPLAIRVVPAKRGEEAAQGDAERLPP